MGPAGERESWDGRVASTRGEPHLDAPPIVGIGASPLTPEPLTRLLDELPAGTGLSAVVVRPSPAAAGHDAARVPALRARLRVIDAEDGAPLLPERVYVCPPTALPWVMDGCLRLTPAPQNGSARHPIDFFFSSLARERKEKAIGIVLRGTGVDGSSGLRAIKAAGGFAMAEASALSADPLRIRDAQPAVADLVLPVGRMPAQLRRYVVHLRIGGGEDQKHGAPITAAELAAAVGHLDELTGGDFGGYAREALERTVRRRMAVRQVRSLSGYLKVVGRDPAEGDRLERDLLLRATGFPPDRDAWEALRNGVVGPLVRAAEKGRRLRVWAPCCSAGEDAYCLATLLHDAIARTRTDLGVQIFATDLDPVMIHLARAGVFPDLDPSSVPADLLSECFVRRAGGYQIARAVRQSMAFAVHRVVSDPPFPDLDLVVGRGIMSRLQPKHRDRLLSGLRHVLRPSGILLIGEDEEIGGGLDPAEAVCPGWGLHRVERFRPDQPVIVPPTIWLEAPKRSDGPARATESAPPPGAAEPDLTPEEIRTLHAELRSVNARLLARVTELERVNDALSNLIAGSEATTLFLDARLRIERVTPPVRGVLSLGPADVGRAIAATAAKGVDVSLAADARRALDGELVPESEVISPSGRCYVRRLLPHRSSDDRVVGVVVTYTDITRIRRARDELANRLSQQAGVAELGQFALGTRDVNRLMRRTVRIVARLLKADFAGVLAQGEERDGLLLRNGVGWKQGFVGRCRVPAGNRSHAGYALKLGRPLVVPDVSAQRRFKPARLLKAHGIVSVASVVIEGPEGPFGILGAYTLKRRSFSEDDVNFMTAASNVLSLALQRGYARQRLERLNEELEERVASRTSMLRLQQDVASAANAAETVERAARFALERICRSTSWKVGRVAPVADDLAADLLPSGVWYASADQRARSLQRSLVGRTRNGTTRHGPRARAAVSFPVKVDREVVAVLELFSKDRIERDNRLSAVLSYVGSELGCVITRKRAERKIRDSERLMRAFFEAAPAALARLDPGGKVMFANPLFARMLGLKAETAVGRSLHQIVHPAQRGALARALRDTRAGSDESRSLDVRLARRDGSLLRAELQLSAVRDEDGRLRRWVAVLHDVGERRRVEREIAKAAEDEQTRMGSDLHDGLGQQLTGIEILAQTLSRRAAAGPLAKDASALHESIRDAKQQLKAIVRGQQPVDAHPRGLMRALRRLADVARRMFGVDCAFDCRRPVLVRDTAVASHLFRIAQEALHNAVRHGRAGRIVIRLRRLRGRLALQVLDDGVGMATRSDAPSGFGLRIARHRAVLIGATLDVRARPRAGCLVECVVPWGDQNGAG